MVIPRNVIRPESHRREARGGHANVPVGEVITGSLFREKSWNHNSLYNIMEYYSSMYII